MGSTFDVIGGERFCAVHRRAAFVSFPRDPLGHSSQGRVSSFNGPSARIARRHPHRF